MQFKHRLFLPEQYKIHTFSMTTTHGIYPPCLHVGNTINCVHVSNPCGNKAVKTAP